MPHKGIREKGQVSPKFIIAAVAGAVLLAAAYFFIVPSGEQPAQPSQPIQPARVQQPETVCASIENEVIDESDKNRLVRATLLSVQNNVVSLKTGDNELKMVYDPDNALSVQRRVGRSIEPFSPAEIPPCSAVTAYTVIEGGRESVLQIILE